MRRRPIASFSWKKNAASWECLELCIIIDANVAHMFGTPPHPDMAPIVRWLTQPRTKEHAVTGGELRRELDRVEAIRRFFRKLKEAGRLIYKKDELVDEETEKVRQEFEKLNMQHADDPHVIALARMSGSRLLASHDKSSGLHAIFKDRRFLDPPGKIYQNRKHMKLLRKAPKCKTCQK
jgi:hypothetical protein